MGFEGVTSKPLAARVTEGRLVETPSLPFRNTAGAVEPTVKLKSGLTFCGVRTLMVAAPPVPLSSWALISDGEISSSEIGCPLTSRQLLPKTVGSGVALAAMVEELRLLPKTEIRPPEATGETPSAALATLLMMGCGSGAS